MTQIEERVLDLIRSSRRPPDLRTVANSLRLSDTDAAEALCELRRQGLIQTHATASRLRYRLRKEA